MKTFSEIINPIPEGSEETQVVASFPSFTDFMKSGDNATPTAESK